VSLDFPVELAALAEAGPRPRRAARKARAAGASAAEGVTVQDLIAAGLLQPPVKLVRDYKGRELTATVLADGRVRVGAAEFDSLSQAAGAARAQVIGKSKGGRLPPTNGWEFWRLEVGGKRVAIDLRRQEFLKRKKSTA
jgi:hypothetical protein